MFDGKTDLLLAENSAIILARRGGEQHVAHEHESYLGRRHVDVELNFEEGTFFQPGLW